MLHSTQLHVTRLQGLMAKKTAKKKATAAEKEATKKRVAAHRKRLSESGIAFLQVKIPEKQIKKLDRLCRQQDVTRDEMVNQLIKVAGKIPKRKKAA